MVRVALAIALISCSKPAPKKPEPPPVVVTAPAPECDLPPLPSSIEPAIGWPTPEEILITKTDFLSIVQFVQGLSDWIRAAQACLEGQR